MDLYVDGRKCTAQAAGATLEEALATIRTEHLDGKSAILSLTCDGIDLFGQELESALSKHADQFSRVDVQTGDPRRLVADALDDAARTLEAVEQKRGDVVHAFASGRTSEGMKLMAACIGDWTRINDAIIQSLAFLAPRNATLAARVPEIVGMLDPVKERLTGVKQSVMQRDFVTLADILEYEFDDVRTCWKRAIDAVMHEALSSDNAGDANRLRVSAK